MIRFVGRDAELSSLRAVLDEARSGAPRLVLVEGPPGIGKTAFVDQFVAQHPDIRVVRAIGDEAEKLVPYGAVEQLARSAGGLGRELLDQLKPGASAIDDHVSIGIRVLELLGALQDPGPVVIVLDDVQWVDLPSLRAVIFALRRLVADQILTVAISRDASVPDLPESLTRMAGTGRNEIMRIHGLDEGDLTKLASSIGAGELSPPAARLLRAGTLGNPLYARAMLEEFSVEEWSQRDRELPTPRSFRAIVLNRYELCSLAAQQLIDSVAVLGMRCQLSLAAQLVGIDDPLQALEEAGKTDLLHLVEGSLPRMVAFEHPLVRSAVYEAMGPAYRAGLHAAAATLGMDRASVLRHKIAAAPGTDSALAQELTQYAEVETEREAWAAAAAHLVLASRLSPSVVDQQHRLLRAVNLMLIGGDALGASRFVNEIRHFPAGALRDAVLGYLATANRDTATAGRMLRSAWDQCDNRTDPELAATIALQNAIHFHFRLRGAQTVAWSRRAIALAAPGSWTRRMATAQCAYGLGYAGRSAEAFAMLDAQSLGAADDQDGAGTQETSVRGWLCLLDERLSDAKDNLTAVKSTAVRLGILNTAAVHNVYLARVAFLTGEWDSAVVDADRAIAVSTESASGYLHTLSYSSAVAVPAARGNWATAERYIAKATARPDTYERSIVAVSIARAQVASARGDGPGVLDALTPVLDLGPVDGIDEPGAWPWQDLYAEALVASGRTAEADAFLRPHEATAATRHRPVMSARLARSRGRIEAAAGRLDSARSAFLASLTELDNLPVPFDKALTELAFGQFQRRNRHRAAAAALLVAAKDGFTALGAEPFISRCEQELVACGVDAGPRQRYQDGLTPQEVVVARSVAAGRTNKEVAAELVVSVKTIEFHLRRIYHKLGVTSRRQLAGKLAGSEEVGRR